MADALVRLVIPDGVDFSDLKLTRDPDTGDVSFDWTPIERICEASGIDADVFRSDPEDNVSGLIVRWYTEHRAAGGAHDPVAADIIAETMLEDEHGGGFSHPPGRA